MAPVAGNVHVKYGGRTNKAQIPEHLLLKLEALFPTYPMYRRSIVRPPYHEEYSKLRSWFEDKNLDGVSVTLYGEGYGPKIQNSGEYRNDPSFVLFDVRINDSWLSREGVQDVADNLGIDCVPSLGTGTLWEAIDMVRGGITSSWGDFEAEGLVIRPTVPLFNSRGERIITKIKSVDFR